MDRDSIRKKFGGSVVSGLAAFLTTWLVASITAEGINPVVTSLVVATFSVGVVFAYEMLPPVLRRYKHIRRALYEVARFEGYWTQRVSIGARPAAFAKIYYDPSRGTWVYRGTAFDVNGDPAARWETESVTFDAREREWFFKGRCQWVKRSSGKWMEVEPASEVFCRMKLPRGETRKIGQLYALDLNLGKQPQGFLAQLRKVSGDVLEAHTGHRSPHRIEKISYKNGAAIVRSVEAQSAQAVDDE